MLPYISDSLIDSFIEEDVPYGDLTTHLLGIGPINGKITFSTRHETTLCCTEEAARLLQKLGSEPTYVLETGTTVPPATDFLRATGTARSLHSAWKAALNLIEYASGIATRTRRIVTAARQANPGISVVTTRKSFPGTKRIAIKAVVAGGALPHRLGLSESILVFGQHTAFTGGLEAFLERLPELRSGARETKLIVEADNVEEALLAARHDVDIVQVDKATPAQLSDLVPRVRSLNPGVTLSAAGGINETNVTEYASTGVDIIVLSSVYFGKPADIQVRILPDEEEGNA